MGMGQQTLTSLRGPSSGAFCRGSELTAALARNDFIDVSASRREVQKHKEDRAAALPPLLRKRQAWVTVAHKAALALDPRVRRLEPAATTPEAMGYDFRTALQDAAHLCLLQIT